MNTQSPKPAEYENNPLVVTIEGLKLMFNKAQQVAIFVTILIGIVSIFSFVMQIIGSLAEQTLKSSQTAKNEEQIAQMNQALQSGEVGLIVMIVTIGLVVYIGILLLAAYLSAIADYTAARVAAGKSTTLREAASVSWQKFGGYLWVMVLVGLKTFAWSLLLIVPGIYKSIRYSLAGVSYFSDSENLRGDKAVQHSNRLTGGAWLTTFSSLTFFNMLTGGLIELLLKMSSKAVLFRQFKAIGDEPKPQAHVLSWIGLLLPIVIVGLLIAFVAVMIVLLAASGELKFN